MKLTTVFVRRRNIEGAYTQYCGQPGARLRTFLSEIGCQPPSEITTSPWSAIAMPTHISRNMPEPIEQTSGAPWRQTKTYRCGGALCVGKLLADGPGM